MRSKIGLSSRHIYISVEQFNHPEGCHSGVQYDKENNLSYLVTTGDYNGGGTNEYVKYVSFDMDYEDYSGQGFPNSYRFYLLGIRRYWDYNEDKYVVTWFIRRYNADGATKENFWDFGEIPIEGWLPTSIAVSDDYAIVRFSNPDNYDTITPPPVEEPVCYIMVLKKQHGNLYLKYPWGGYIYEPFYIPRVRGTESWGVNVGFVDNTRFITQVDCIHFGRLFHSNLACYDVGGNMIWRLETANSVPNDEISSGLYSFISPKSNLVFQGSKGDLPLPSDRMIEINSLTGEIVNIRDAYAEGDYVNSSLMLYHSQNFLGKIAPIGPPPHPITPHYCMTYEGIESGSIAEGCEIGIYFRLPKYNYNADVEESIDKYLFVLNSVSLQSPILKYEITLFE